MLLFLILLFTQVDLSFHFSLLNMQERERAGISSTSHWITNNQNTTKKRSLFEWNGGHYKRGKGREERREEEEKDLISKDNSISEFISDGTWITRTHAGSLPSICCCFYECTSGSIPSKVPCCSVGIHAGWVGFAVIHIHTYFTSCCIKINVNHVCSPYCPVSWCISSVCFCHLACLLLLTSSSYWFLKIYSSFLPSLSYLLLPFFPLFAFSPTLSTTSPFGIQQNRRTTFNRHNAQNVQNNTHLLSAMFYFTEISS